MTQYGGNWPSKSWNLIGQKNFKFSNQGWGCTSFKKKLAVKVNPALITQDSFISLKILISIDQSK
jgi:hypothetical protein